ncbi:MAG TPA: cation transporter, partial [Nitrospirota bacterium]|nr:cation transporter [Nitrospirota bacterium]
MIPLTFTQDNRKFYSYASALALITIFYNIVEGLVSVLFGLEDGSMALFGFGVDSFVEVVSGIGIWHMVRRIRNNGSENPDRFEQTALRITGAGFYSLALGLSIAAAVDLYRGHKPETTFWGIVISVVSIGTMWLLIHYKVKVGKRLRSEAILADAACTRACLQLSVVLLVASAGFELTHFGGIDSLGTFVIAGLCLREGREAL